MSDYLCLIIVVVFLSLTSSSFVRPIRRVPAIPLHRQSPSLPGRLSYTFPSSTFHKCITKAHVFINLFFFWYYTRITSVFLSLDGLYCQRDSFSYFLSTFIAIRYRTPQTTLIQIPIVSVHRQTLCLHTFATINLIIFFSLVLCQPWNLFGTRLFCEPSSSRLGYLFAYFDSSLYVFVFNPILNLVTSAIHFNVSVPSTRIVWCSPIFTTRNRTHLCYRSTIYYCYKKRK